MAQKDIEMYAKILSESETYEKENELMSRKAKLLSEQLDLEEFDQLEDEIIKPHDVGFVDSEEVDEMDEVDFNTQDYDYEKIGNASIDLNFEGDADMFDQFTKVVNNYIRERRLEGKIQFEPNKYRCEMHLEGSIDILKDIYAMFNGLDSAEDLETADVQPFDDFASFDFMREADDVDEDDDEVIECGEAEDDIDESDYQDDKACSVVVEIREEDIAEFRKILRNSIRNISTTVDSSRGKGFDGHSAFINISGPYENVKDAYAFYSGVESFDVLTPEQMKEFDEKVEFADGDSLAEADYRERISHDLDKYGIKSSTANLKAKDDAAGISVVEELKKKVESLEKKLARGSKLIKEEETDDVKDAVVDAAKKALDGKEETSTAVMSDEQWEEYDAIGDETAEDYKEKAEYLQKLISAEKDPSKKSGLEEMKKSNEEMAELLGNPLHKSGVGKPQHEVVGHCKNWYLTKSGEKKYINNDVMTRDQWDQYDQLVKLRKSGKTFTPSQQELWDSLIEQVSHAEFFTDWKVYAPASTRSGNGVPDQSYSGDSDEDSPQRELGAIGGDADDDDNLGTGLAQQDYDNVDIDASNSRIDREDVYQGKIPTFDPDIDRDMKTDVRSISKQQKKLTAAQRELLHDKALAVAKRVRGTNELWSTEDWKSILLGLSKDERKNLYHELIDQSILLGTNVSGEQAALKKLFGRERFTSNYDGGSMVHGDKMTADQKKAASRAKQKESEEYYAFFTQVRMTLQELAKRFPTDRFLSQMLVKLEQMYTIAYIWKPEQWEETAKEWIQSGEWWNTQGIPKEWLNLKNLVTSNGEPKIDKATGEPKEPKMYVNFPSKFDVSKDMFGIMLPMIVKHVAEDADMTAAWKELMTVNGRGSSTLKAEIKANRAAEDKANPPKQRAKRKPQA